MSGARPRYEPGLDGVRALALAAVLAFHDGRLAGGFLGVSTFFTLSGFLITGLLLAERRRAGRVSLRDFFARRVRRLLPAAVLGILVAAAVTATLHDAHTSRSFRFDAIAALGDVANWRFLWAGRSYASLFATPSPLLHFWSLAIEEQFYLVLAPVVVGLLVLARGRRRVVAAALAALAAASFADGWLAVGHGFDRAYYGTDTRALEFLVGALVAVLVGGRRLGARQSRAVAVAGVPALAGLVWATAAARVGDAGLFRGGLLAYAAAGAIVVVAACEPGPVRRLCSLAPLRKVGRISYGAYVFHWPLFIWLTRARTGLAPLPLTGVRVAATLAVAGASFVLVEQPIRTRRALIGRARWVAAPAGASAAALAALLVAGAAPAPAVTFAPALSRSSVLSAPQPASTSPPRAPAPTARPVRRVFVVGDSVALTLGRGIERWGVAHGVEVLNGGAIGCALLTGVEVRGYWGITTRGADPCRTRESWPATLRQFDPDVVVVLFGAWDVYDASLDGGRTWLSPGQAPWDRHYTAEITDAVHRLRAAGARVLWLTPPCFAPAPGASDAGAPWYEPARVDVLGRLARSAARRAGATVSDVVHDAGCPVDFGARPDGVHYSDAGADAVLRTLGPLIARLR